MKDLTHNGRCRAHVTTQANRVPTLARFTSQSQEDQAEKTDFDAHSEYLLNPIAETFLAKLLKKHLE